VQLVAPFDVISLGGELTIGNQGEDALHSFGVLFEIFVTKEFFDQGMVLSFEGGAISSRDLTHRRSGVSISGLLDSIELMSCVSVDAFGFACFTDVIVTTSFAFVADALHLLLTAVASNSRVGDRSFRLIEGILSCQKCVNRLFEVDGRRVASPDNSAGSVD